MKLRTYPVGPASRIVALLGWAATVAGVLIIVHQIGDVHVRTVTAGALLLFVGGPLGLYATLLLVFGTASLHIDPVAGKVRFVRTGRLVFERPLRELPALSTHGRGARFELRAGDDVVFRAATRRAVEDPLREIELLVAVSEVRAILATTVVGDGAFRDAPDVVQRVRQAVPDDTRLHAAIDLLAKDPDDDVRTRAAALRSSLSTGSPHPDHA